MVIVDTNHWTCRLLVEILHESILKCDLNHSLMVLKSVKYLPPCLVFNWILKVEYGQRTFLRVCLFLVAQKNERVLLLWADDIDNLALNQFCWVLIVIPLHILISCQHPDYIVLEEDHDAGHSWAFLLSKLDHPNIDVAEAKGISSCLLVIERVAIFSQHIGKRWSQMTPRLLSANLCVHVTDRDHVEMDNDNEIIIDEEIREEL